MEGKQKKLKIVIGILSCLLLISLGVLAYSIQTQKQAVSLQASVSVEENVIRSEKETIEETAKKDPQDENQQNAALEKEQTKNPVGNASASKQENVQTAENTVALTLKKHHAEENEPFYAGNLFPGDLVQKNYRVEVSYKNSITVHFRIEIQKGYEKLAEVMKCQVLSQNDGKILYDGLMKDLPRIDRYLTTGSEATENLQYTIIAYLDTSVGNEYQNQELKADFYWWVEGEDAKNLTTSQGAYGTSTGDHAWTGLWIMIAICAAAGILLLWKKQKKEEKDRV